MGSPQPQAASVAGATLELTELHRLKARAAAAIDAVAGLLDELALRIHAHPETAYEERLAVSALADRLRAAGHPVTRALGGLDTAFSSETRSGPGPTVAILAEYDALPGIGHGCGHHLIATAALGAYLGSAAALEAPARGAVRLIGTPAEERGAGKVRLLKANAFAGVDAALMFHPADDDVLDPLMLALRVLRIEFRGRAAHAAAAPHAGRNALDGLLLGWSAISALRQLVRVDSRIHGIITEGGQAPNIIPERAVATVVVRAADPAYLEELRHRVLACFEGAARATGCALVHDSEEEMDLVTTNAPLAEAFAANARALGRTLRVRRPGETSGSTDMGNVSAVIPAIHPFLAVGDGPIPWHSHDFAAASRTPRALETMHLAAKALAFTALDALAEPALLQSAKDAHRARPRP